jgi:hypothetical protein
MEITHDQAAATPKQSRTGSQTILRRRVHDSSLSAHCALTCLKSNSVGIGNVASLTNPGEPSMRFPFTAAALLSAVLSYPAFAQSSADHEAHHPGQSQVSPPMETESPAGPSAERQGTMRGGGMMGMMGRGMKGEGMMGAGGMGPPIMFRMIFALMDADGDGTISLPEFQVAHERIFKAMDSNKDGKLTLDEMQAFMRGTKNLIPQQ